MNLGEMIQSLPLPSLSEAIFKNMGGLCAGCAVLLFDGG